MKKVVDKFNFLRAWGLTGDDLRARGWIGDRKISKLAEQLNDLKAWGVTGSDLGPTIGKCRIQIERLESLRSDGQISYQRQ